MSTASESVKAMAAPPAQTASPAPSPASVFLAALRRRYLAATLSVVGGLALWEIASRFLVANALFLAGPSQIAVAIYHLAVTGQLWHHIGVSAAEFAVGYVVASALGI